MKQTEFIIKDKLSVLNQKGSYEVLIDILQIYHKHLFGGSENIAYYLPFCNMLQDKYYNELINLQSKKENII